MSILATLPNEQIGAHMPGVEQPNSPPGSDGSDESDNNGNNRKHRRHGPRPAGPHCHHHGGRGHRGFGPASKGGPHGPHGFERGPGRNHRHHHPLFDGAFEQFGSRGGRGGMFGGPRGGPHGHHHHGFPGHHHRGGRGGRPPFWPGPQGFEFLQRFASEMGNGFEDLFSADRNVNDSQIDFVPRADVFDTANEYVVHVSLPGAQKSDVSVDYDAQESTLRLAGVTHRPEFNEELHDAMVTNERRREVGVFERTIKLNARDRQSVVVDQEKISAKMVDGVLIVRLPKAEGEQENKKIVVNEDVDGEKDESDVTNNEKHASMVEVQDEFDSMEIHSETEAGDLLQEVGDTTSTPSRPSEEDGLEDADEAGEYVKVDVK